jgi:hypothetical protein
MWELFMELLKEIFLFLHFIGLASLLGGSMVAITGKQKVFNGAILHGALTQLVTGIALFIITLSKVNHAKVTIKLAILAVILIVTVIKRKKEDPGKAVMLIAALTVVNIGLAVFW